MGTISLSFDKVQPASRNTLLSGLSAQLTTVRTGDTWKILRRTVRDILSPQACARHFQMQKAESARLMYDLLRQPDVRIPLSIPVSSVFVDKERSASCCRTITCTTNVTPSPSSCPSPLANQLPP